MMKRIVIISGLLLLIVFQCGYGNSTLQKLQSMHRRIGTDLLKIKKQYSQAQPVVYALLDQVGEFYSLAKQSVKKKGTYKKELLIERGVSQVLKKELDTFKDKVGSMRHAMFAVDKKLKKDARQVGKLATEKDALTREKEKIIQEKNVFEQEKQALVAERDALVREKDAALRERDVLTREKEELLRERDKVTKQLKA